MSKLYSSAICLNSLDEYQSPLSLMTVSGMPCLANSVFNAIMMFLEVVEERVMIYCSILLDSPGHHTEDLARR